MCAAPDMQPRAGCDFAPVVCVALARPDAVHVDARFPGLAIMQTGWRVTAARPQSGGRACCAYGFTRFHYSCTRMHGGFMGSRPTSRSCRDLGSAGARRARIRAPHREGGGRARVGPGLGLGIGLELGLGLRLGLGLVSVSVSVSGSGSGSRSGSGSGSGSGFGFEFGSDKG